jgi:hypothetical protein
MLFITSSLDTGQFDDISVDEVEAHIRDGSTLRFLHKKTNDHGDFNMFFDRGTYDNFESSYAAHLQSILDAYGGNEMGKWGVKNRGLCLLIAWTNEIIKRGSGWRPPDVA